jgi:hypothetical protein
MTNSSSLNAVRVQNGMMGDPFLAAVTLKQI